MAGHSKWANIKHKKAAEDAKKGKVFTRLAREIAVVAREGGGDPAMNPRLRLLLDKARHENLPNENVTRAIKKGLGELEGAQDEQIFYEGYGPHGVAVIIEALSNNRNRTVADVRHVFSKFGCSLGENGTVGWMFGQKSVLGIENCAKSEDALLELFLDHGAEDITLDSEHKTARVVGDIGSLFELKRVAEESHLKVTSARIEWVAHNTVELDDESSEKVYQFLERLDDLDDVQNVYPNLA